MSVMPVEFGALPIPSVSPIAPPAGPAATGAASGDFAAALTRGIDSVQQLQTTAESLAVQAATGDLQDVHDYTIAATQAQLATELTVAIRNKAVESFNEIMRMPV